MKRGSNRASGTPRMAQRGSWELPRRPGDSVGVLWDVSGKPFGVSRERWERTRRKSENHWFSLRNSPVFKIPGAPKGAKECFGDVLGRLVGASGGSWEAFGSSWGLWRRLCVLLRLRKEALGCYQSISERLLGAPERPWGASRSAFGTSRAAF